MRRGAWIALAAALCAGAPRADEPPTLQRILTQAETTRALDRVLLYPRRFVLRNGPRLEDMAAIVVCSGERFEGGLTFRVEFEGLEGDTTRFDYVIEAGVWTRLTAGAYQAGRGDPTHEATVDLRASPPQVTQRDLEGARDPVALPWKGDELGELFLLFVLGPLSDCGVDALGAARVVQELSLLGPAERCTPLGRTLKAKQGKDGRRSLEVLEGDAFSARIRFGEGMFAGDIARLEFSDGLYADPITEGTYDTLHHAVPVRLQPAPTYAATDTLRAVRAAQWAYRQKFGEVAPSLARLGEVGFLDSATAAGKRLGWRVALAASEDGERWVARARSAYRDEPGSFAINERGELVVAPAVLPLDPSLPFPEDARRIPLTSRW